MAPEAKFLDYGANILADRLFIEGDVHVATAQRQEASNKPLTTVEVSDGSEEGKSQRTELQQAIELLGENGNILKIISDSNGQVYQDSKPVPFFKYIFTRTREIITKKP